MKNARRWIFVLVPLLALVFLIFGRIQAVKADEAKQKAEAGARRGAAPAVEIATAQSRPLVKTIDAVGSIVSEYTVNISPRSAGRITYLELREGDSVTAGQLLARIDPNQADAQILQGKASVSESRSRLAQAEATIQSNEVQIEQGIRQARAEVTTANAELTQTRRSVEARVASARSAIKQAEGALASAQAELRNRRAEVTASKANLKNAELRLNRIKSQYEKGYIAAQEVDDAIAVMASAQADVNVKQGEVESAESSIETAQSRLELERTNLSTTQASGNAEIESAQARVEQAKSGLTAAEANRAQSPANRENVNALKAGVSAAEAQLQAADAQKSDTELRSSISGIITQRSADPGSLASPGQAVLRVESIDALYVNATIPVEESARVKKGQVVSITIDGLEDGPIQAYVDQVVPSANAQDRQFLVKVKVGNKDRKIRPGMFAKVSIEIERSEADVVIPADAIEDGSVTVVNAEGETEKRKVVTGKSDSQGVEILDGLDVGEKVIVLSFSPVKPGGKVTVTAERLMDGSRRVIEPEKAAPKGDKQ